MLGAGFVVEVEADGAGLARRLATVAGVTNVETLAADRFRMTADRDVRPDAARAVVAANGSLRRLSVDEPSLEAIYARYFQDQTGSIAREHVMRREGSPFQGLGTVAVKELSDNLSSARMFVLELLIVLTALAALYGAIDNLRQNTAEDPFLLLRLFTVDHAPLPSFVAILGFLIPLMAIGLGFDAVNSEHNRRTLSRILAQPIYRDALLMGKFVAGLDDARDQPGGAVAAGDRPRPDLPRRAAGRRGDRALAGVPGDRDLLCRRLARRWRCCCRSCSARRRPRRWSRSASGCS